MVLNRLLAGIGFGGASVETVLDTLGFAFKSADLEEGHLRRTWQQLSFYQEIEHYSPRRHQGLNELEPTMTIDHRGPDVILELDKKCVLLFSEGSDTFHRFGVDHHGGAGRDWSGHLRQ